MFLKEMYVAKRCFKECNSTIREVVSVGYSCMPIRYIYAAFLDAPNELCAPEIGFENYILEENAVRSWNVCKDINKVVFIAKENLNKDEQILYCELYKGNIFDGMSNFEFCGYDLLEVGASAIYDCDFNIDKTNDWGLIPTITEAIEVDIKLRNEFPYEQHAHCDIYAVWRYVK
ncbi:MAG: hypothetical protein LBT20_00250 [Clostridiales bacterium]|nr:hypothetical protein [Clostridiales bacterium]